MEILSFVWAHLFKIIILITIAYFVWKNYLSARVYNLLYTTPYKETLSSTELERNITLVREQQQRLSSVLSAQHKRDKKQKHHVTEQDPISA
jgi:hypothetical protein